MRDEKAWKWLNENELSYTIWNNKYRYNNESFDEWLDRISAGNESVRELILNKKFIFGGRILANRGVTDKKVTYSNCYLITPPNDDLESIFECAGKLARTFSYGGGCGIDLSNLRPRGAKTNNAAKESSGAVSFMDIFSSVTGTISQRGRRGALMISLDINHPDIEEFIDCKTDLSRVNFANISVRVSDEFMKAVENDNDYLLQWPCSKYNEYRGRDLVGYDLSKLNYNELYTFHDNLGKTYIYSKKIRAKDLYNKLVKNNWNYAEPGILYWDRIEGYNLMENDPDFHYAGVNPCANISLAQVKNRVKTVKAKIK